MEDLKLLRWLF